MKTDFMHRTITFDGPTFHDADGEVQQITVTRTRTTNGFASITMQFGKQRIEFNSDIAEGYEQAARSARELLDSACSESCTIPSST